MDGVLLDTEPLYTVAFDRVLAPFGRRLDPPLKRALMGRRIPQSVAIVVAAHQLPLSSADFLARLEPELEALFAAAPAMPGAIAVVEALAYAGVRMAVATSTARALFERKTAQHPWFAMFDVIVCGDDPAIGAPKPAPDIFRVAADRLGVVAEDTFVIEDSPAGVTAASVAGAYVIALVDADETDPAFDLADRRISAWAQLDGSLGP